MPSADSIIRVSIIGDAKKLTGALGEADKSTGGLLKSAGKALVGLAVIDKAFDFAQTAVAETDRLGDAMTRLNISIGETNTAKLADAADDYTAIGLSTQDVLEGAAAFADLGTNAGIAAPDIANLSDDVAATAAAMALLDDSDAAGNIDLIGKAAAGNAKAMRSLGINISETDVLAAALAATGKTTAASLTEGEKATARLNLVLAALKPKLDAATTGSGDLEQSQAELQARAETLAGKLGGPLSDSLNTVVGFILDEIDAIPGAIKGWQMLGGAIESFGRHALGPLGNVRDALNGILSLLGQVTAGSQLNSSDTLRRRNPGGRPSESTTVRNLQRASERTGGIGRSMGGP